MSPGAAAVLGSRPVDVPMVVVPDPVEGLGRLAGHVVRRLPRARVIALTSGSSALSTAVPPAASASTSSPLVCAIASRLPNSPTCAVPTLRAAAIRAGAEDGERNPDLVVAVALGCDHPLGAGESLEHAREVVLGAGLADRTGQRQHRGGRPVDDVPGEPAQRNHRVGDHDGRRDCRPAAEHGMRAGGVLMAVDPLAHDRDVVRELLRGDPT